MNPGYAGRTELPESIKALFRPVVVIVPDLQQICEIMLFSEGFSLAKVKLISMFFFCSFESRLFIKKFGLDVSQEDGCVIQTISRTIVETISL